MLGLMQKMPLLTTMILRHGARVHGRREIVSKTVDEGVHRYDYAKLESRSRTVAHGLQDLGIGTGDRVATLAWNTYRHLELFYAVPGIGAVLHTVNPRLFVDQIRFVINHGGAKALFFDTNLLELVEQLAPDLPSVQTYVALTGGQRYVSGKIEARNYETLLEHQRPEFIWPELDENLAACLCYTSGTTGDPKGVLYSHRSIVLEAMGASLNGGFGYTASDCVLPAASLYHAMGWAMPYTAPLCGSKLVLPCDKLDGASLYDLIEGEGVTLSTGVPTIWTTFVEHMRRKNVQATSLRRLIIGGSALSRNLAESLDQFGIQVTQGWGMTETSSLGLMGGYLPALRELPPDERKAVLWSTQGHQLFGVETRIVDDASADVAADGKTPGNLLVRGPWVVKRYFGDEKDVVDADGWFDTGDVVTVDRFGYVRISDRRKDLIKSGGEWISSIDLENVVLGCPGVQGAAVIGIPHPKWEERPRMFVVTLPGVKVSSADVMAFLEARVAKWWLPDEIVFVEQLPMTANGKLNKRELRRVYASDVVRSAIPARQMNQSDSDLDEAVE